MPRSRNLFPFVPTPAERKSATPFAMSRTVLLALVVLLALLALVTSTATAQGRAGTPLHVAASRFEFVASGDSLPVVKSLAVHNGGPAMLTDVHLTRLAYADSARGAGWLVAQPRQSSVAPDELATVGTLCVNAAGLPAGTYRATAAVGAREVPEPVAITITLVVTDAGARAGQPAARCGSTASK